MNMPTFAVLSLVGLYLFCWLFAKPVRTMLRFLRNGFVGCAAIFAVNTIFAHTGFFIGINPVTYAVCGCLGISGFGALVCIQLMI